MEIIQDTNSTGDGAASSYTLERRLRVCTARLDAARDIKSIYTSSCADVILCLLTHKIMRAIIDEGMDESRLLLQVIGHIFIDVRSWYSFHDKLYVVFAS